MDRVIRISKNVDYKHLNVLELTGFEEIADTNDEGYLVLPRAQGFADCVCSGSTKKTLTLP